MNAIDSLRSAMASRANRGVGRKRSPTQSGMGQQNAPAQRGQVNKRAVRPMALQSQASRKVEPTPSNGQQRLNKLRQRRAARSTQQSSIAMGGFF